MCITRAESFGAAFETLNRSVEIVCSFHLEISDCGHDVRGGRQSNRRSGYHFQVEMGTETHLCEHGEKVTDR